MEEIRAGVFDGYATKIIKDQGLVNFEYEANSEISTTNIDYKSQDAYW